MARSTALVGPDGAGKTTLIRLTAGLDGADAGELRVLGVDVPRSATDSIAHRLYAPAVRSLRGPKVEENLDLYADLHGVTTSERRERYPRLMEMTAPGPFMHRLAGQLSGGMKQKLGLACTLVRSPDCCSWTSPPWASIRSRAGSFGRSSTDWCGEQLAVLLSTSYLDEAERCGHVVVLHRGQSAGRRAARGRQQPGGGAHLPGRAAGRADGPRELQARLLDVPDVVDAVPEGGRVRFVAPRSRGAADQDFPGDRHDSPVAAAL